MQTLIVGFWIIQGIVMFFDEFVFHHQRGLGKWERMGHPIDSFFLLLPFVYTQFFTNVSVFVALCVFSCLIITKDEIVHANECSGMEQWLHAVLFILHPVALFGLWVAWKRDLDFIIQIQLLIIFSFMLYQIIYWNFLKGMRNETQSR